MYLWFDLVESSPSHIDVGVVVKQTFGFPDHLLTQRRHTLMLKLGSWILSLVLLTTIAFQQHQLIDNQRAQMKQQFHSGGIALVALFGDDGLRKLRSVTDPKYLSDRENFATGLLLQRFIAAYWIRNAFTEQEWQQMVIADGQYTMQSPLLRARWQQLRKWYPREIQDFVEGKLLSNTQ